MTANRWTRTGVWFITLWFVLFYVLEIDAWARAGGGRSVGSRGSRSYSAPRQAPSPAPTNPSSGVRPDTAPSRSLNTPGAAPQGGLFRGMMGGLAGGLLGGMIGSMLFRGSGFAGTGGAGTGGIGLMDILLLGALLYGIYWFIKRRRRAAPAVATQQQRMAEPMPDLPAAGPAAWEAPQAQEREDDTILGMKHIRQMDPGFDEKQFADFCLDQFFRIQGAWAQRDVMSVKDLMTDEVFRVFNGEVERMKAEGKMNRLENIAVRSVEITEVWQEKGSDFVTVRFYANLLDYTVDETSGEVLLGSRTVPVKFEEYWTFTRPVGKETWRLSAIQQGVKN